MNRKIAVVLAVLLTIMVSVVPGAAQQSPPGKPSMPGDTPGMPGGGMPGMGSGMMMCPMMVSMMGRQPDPRVMQMHGEMLKAMGDIMMKHGKNLEGSGPR